LLKHPTLDQPHVLGLYGMAKAFAELAKTDEAKGIDRHDWLALLLDREASLRRDKRLAARLRAAKLRQQARIEDADYRAARGSWHATGFRDGISSEKRKTRETAGSLAS
jgi:hypothetical protein